MLGNEPDSVSYFRKGRSNEYLMISDMSATFDNNLTFNYGLLTDFCHKVIIYHFFGYSQALRM